VISDAADADVQAIAALAETRRVDYEQAQPQFWRRAVNAVDVHRPWVAEMVRNPDVVSLVALDGDRRLVGYVFGTVVPSPPVYAPGGPTGLIDDFQIADPGEWATIGVELLVAARERLAALGVVQIVVVCGQHDQPKREALGSAGLAIASEWYVQSIDRE
jgi:hypothetical protein